MGCLCCCKRETKVKPFKKGQDDVDDVEFSGPLEHRECRDLFFLLFFIAFLVGMGVVAYMAVKQGNPYRLIKGVDSWGNVCDQGNEKIENVPLSGIDTTGKSNVFFFDPDFFTSLLPDSPIPSLTEEQTNMICIKQCPPEEVEVIDYYNNNGINLCRYDVTPYVDDTDKCPATPVGKHTSVFNRCVPDAVKAKAKLIASAFTSVLSKATLGGDMPKKIVSDLKNTWKEILILGAIAAGVALLVVILLELMAGIIIWTMVLMVIVFALGCTVYCWYSWHSLGILYKDMISQQEAQLAQNATLNMAQFDEAQQTVKSWLIYACIASVITIVLLLVLLALRKRIALVVQLFVEAGRAIRKVPFLLLLPFWTLLALIICIAGIAFIASFIETSGLPVVNPVTGHVKYEMEKFWLYIRWYHLFGLLWLSSFIVASQDLIIAGSVASWYFNRSKKNMGWPILRSTKNLIRYHLGSVAFGSFIIAVVKLARIILSYIQSRLKGKAGKVIDFILKMLQCCLWCFEKFLKFLNRNAYIEIAIYGFSFCTSARKAFTLILNNCLRVAAINSIGDFVLLLGKLSTVAIVMVIGNEMLKNRDDINYIWVPITVVCLFGFAISHCFLLVYEIAIDTIFLCFCEDMERNDGTSRPYFMSKNLMKYLDDTEKAEAKNQMKNTTQNQAATKV